MKNLLIPPLTALAFSAFAQSSPLCQQKQQDIQGQIDYARQHGNTPRIAGLERAKAEAGNGCTDEKLKASHAAKIHDQQHEVAERQQELDKARHDGESSKKIAKRQRKLDDAQRELKALQSTEY
jgi:Protein of unknown function (DUF1090)